jgi:hypothetical protein
MHKVDKSSYVTRLVCAGEFETRINVPNSFVITAGSWKFTISSLGKYD